MEPVKIVDKPWGREVWIALTDRYAFKRIEFNKGSRSSLQYHNVKCEHIYVQSGLARFDEEIGGCVVKNDYGPGSVIHNPAGKVHRVEALEDVVLYEVSTPELDDVVRVEDDYDRSDKTQGKK